MPSGVPKRGESLADLFPALAAQWHPTANKKLRHLTGPLKGEFLTPRNVTVGSSKEITWKCDVADDHVWSAVIKNRTKLGNRCPFCAGNQLSATNSLATRFPDVAKEWHPTLNGEVRPEDVLGGTNDKYWWKCAAAPDHVWSAKVSVRTSPSAGTGCPFCSGQQLSVTNRLSDQAQFSEIVKQWHPTLNGELTPKDVTYGSNSEVWWKCDVADDHVWLAVIKNRTGKDTGCHCCSGDQLSVTNRLSDRYPEVAVQWHPTKNENIFHSKGQRRGERVSPENVIFGDPLKVWWKCDVADDHEWLAQIVARTSGGTGCPCCSVPAGQVSTTNSLATLFPRVAAELHPTKNGDLSAEQIIARSNDKVYWQCAVDSSHIWTASPLNRVVAGSGCPHCTLTPRSAQEIRLAHELAALIDFDLDAHKLRFAGRLRDVDILVEDLNLVVEFDGAYWHRNKVDKDREKTVWLEQERWMVIRVRERPLESIHTNDVMVESLTPVKEVANLVFKQIEKVTKTKIPNLKKYLTSKEPWREEEALAAIRAYQAERAAAKAERAAKKAARSK